MSMDDYAKCVTDASDPRVNNRMRQRAFSELVARFQAMAYGCAAGILSDPMLADDAAQEAFITAWQNLSKLRKPEAFPAWLHRIVVWQCYYYQRREQGSTVPVESLVEELLYEQDTSASVEQDDLNRRIWHLIAALPKNAREILILHYQEEYSHEEIARFLDISAGAVRKRLHDAHRKLKTPLGRMIGTTVRRHRPSTPERYGGKPMSDRKGKSAKSSLYPTRTPEDVIAGMIKPVWCENAEQGRITWDLFCAAIRNDTTALKRHLDEDPDRAWFEFWYTPPIYFAAREGNLAAVRILWKAYPYEQVTNLIRMADDRGHEGVADYLRRQIGAGAADSDMRLHEAVESGDMEEMDRLLAGHPELTGQRDPHGRTPLHLAVLHGRGDAVTRLLKAGAPVDETDHQGFRPVHYAFWNTYWHFNGEGASLAQQLLDHGSRDSITLAAARGDMSAVRAFLQSDRTLSNDGDTLQKRPISAATERRHRDMVRLLLDHGADPTLRETRVCPHGSALMAATVNDDLELAEMLLAAGADPNGDVDSSGWPASRAGSDAMRGLLYSYGGKPNPAWGYIQQGDLETLAAILRYTDDPFAQDTSEYLTTPYTAIISGCLRRMEREESTEAHEAMLRLFLRRGYPMPKTLTECRSYLWHVPAMTRQLLEHGLDPNLPDWQRCTPLHDLASRSGVDDQCLELVDMLLEFGADIQAIDEENRSTPLGLAARTGEKRLVRHLLERGADPNLAGAPWATPLAWAEKRGHREIVEVLRKHGAEA